MKKLKQIFLVLTSFTILFAGCNSIDSSSTSLTSSTTETTTVTTTPPPPPEPDPVARVVAVGDNLIHSSLYKQAKARATDGTYDFAYAYQYVKDLIEPADLAILNQETPICNDLFEPSTYPLFNSPTQLGDEMIDIGFNVVSHCNNHILDKGEKGMLATLDYWESRNITTYGAYRNDEDLNNIRVENVNGISFAFVGFMEHTNGLRLPEDSEARLIYTSDRENMERLVRTAGYYADVVVVSVHWGVETLNQVNDSQKNLAKDFVDWGADLIIGTQPHTVQTMEYLDKPDGGKAFVAYSLGNFISAQARNLQMVGALIDLNVRKELATGNIIIEDIKAIPIITHYEANYANIRNYPYSLYTTELANSHGVRVNGWFDMDFINKLVDENIPEEFRCLT